MPPAPLGGGSSYTTHYLKEGRNGQTVGDLENYNDIMFTREAIRVINAHDPKIPLFSYIAFQTCHDPLEAPDEYIEKYPPSWREDRRWYAASEYSKTVFVPRCRLTQTAAANSGDAVGRHGGERDLGAASEGNVG